MYRVDSIFTEILSYEHIIWKYLSKFKSNFSYGGTAHHYQLTASAHPRFWQINGWEGVGGSREALLPGPPFNHMALCVFPFDTARRTHLLKGSGCRAGRGRAGGEAPAAFPDHYNTPLVEGTPWARGSGWVAASRARPAALKMASMMWWVFSP